MHFRINALFSFVRSLNLHPIQKLKGTGLNLGSRTMQRGITEVHTLTHVGYASVDLYHPSLRISPILLTQRRIYREYLERVLALTEGLRGNSILVVERDKAHEPQQPVTREELLAVLQRAEIAQEKGNKDKNPLDSENMESIVCELLRSTLRDRFFEMHEFLDAKRVGSLLVCPEVKDFFYGEFWNACLWNGAMRFDGTNGTANLDLSNFWVDYYGYSQRHKVDNLNPQEYLKKELAKKDSLWLNQATYKGLKEGKIKIILGGKPLNGQIIEEILAQHRYEDLEY